MLKINFRINRKKIKILPKPKKYDLIENEKIIHTTIPLHLDGDLEKVTKVPFGISLEDELKDFNSKTYKSGPFYSYKLENVLLLKNRLYFGKYEYPIEPNENPIRLYDSNKIQMYENATFSSTRISTVFFGHWLREELILIDYLQGKKDIITSSPLTPQKKEIMEFFNLNCDLTSYAKVKYADMYEGWQHSDLYNGILAKYKQKISLLSGKYQKNSRPKVVYLKRGPSSTKRILENEDMMLDLLANDFEVLSYEAETTPVKELYAAIYSASIILSIEGSQMAHAIIAGKPGSALICIQPPDRFYNPFKNYCSDVGLLYAVFVADPSVTNENFCIDSERFKNLLEKVVNKMSFIPN